MENQENNIAQVRTNDLYKPKVSTIKTVIFSAVGIVIFIICFLASKTLKSAGTEISLIKSVGGKTLEEAYYQSVGLIYFSLGNVVIAIGIFLCTVLIWCGLRKE